MRGRIGIVNEPLQDESKVKALMKEIVELNKRKNNIKNEIESVIGEARLRLEEEYQKKTKDLEITFSSRMVRLEQERDEIQKEKSSIVERDAINVKVRDRLDFFIKEQKEAKKRNLELLQKLEEREKAIEESLVRERKIIEEREIKVEDESKRISVEIKRLEGLKREVEPKESSIISRESSLTHRENSLADLEIKTVEKEKGLVLLEEAIHRNINDTAIFKMKADKSLAKAKVMEKQAEETLKGNEVLVEETKKAHEELTPLRDSLNEKKTTLKEKEKFLILKEREIDSKIKTIKKLREER